MKPRIALEIGAIAIVTTSAFFLFFSHRSDYAGHYAAGLGATLLMLGAWIAVSGRGLGWNVVWLVLAAILFGVGTEATIFHLAIFDPVDFFNQSLGAVVAGFAVPNQESERLTGLVVLPLGFLVLVAGFLLAFA